MFLWRVGVFCLRKGSKCWGDSSQLLLWRLAGWEQWEGSSDGDWQQKSVEKSVLLT